MHKIEKDEPGANKNKKPLAHNEVIVFGKGIITFGIPPKPLIEAIEIVEEVDRKLQQKDQKDMH